MQVLLSKNPPTCLSHVELKASCLCYNILIFLSDGRTMTAILKGCAFGFGHWSFKTGNYSNASQVVHLSTAEKLIHCSFGCSEHLNGRVEGFENVESPMFFQRFEEYTFLHCRKEWWLQFWNSSMMAIMGTLFQWLNMSEYFL